ncbi:MAG TPA: FAD-binding oxidoreductase [Candidatus Angelobacter sp.]|jgi:CDP-4-dehydro-6-deoxyglucose reductase|nr:FAD-binding oxidoreductase [Candidatus Angelobacter sp.]
MNSHAPAPAKEEISEQLLNATLIKSVPLSSSAHHLTFRVESEEPLEFLPGQSICLEVAAQGDSTPSPYSIASAPCGDNSFELCLRRGAKGSAAARLCDLHEGTQVRSTRPKGVFVLQQPAGDTVFLAAGTGIAPIRSMIHWLLRNTERRSEARVGLIFGARDRESLFFHHEFLELTGKHTNFHYLPTLSRPSANWHGACGYVQDHLHRLQPNPENAHAYLCGPAAMITSARQALNEQGWPEKRVHHEKHDIG